MSTYKILSLDGGGIRGILSARILHRLTNVCPNLLDQVDLLAGTSTGAILAVLLAKGMSPADIVNVYKETGPTIFKDPLLHQILDLYGVMAARYNTEDRYTALHTYIGDITLGDLVPRRVLIPTFQLDSSTDPTDLGPRRWKPKLFHNFPGADSDAAQSALDVVMRSTAAPTFFPIYAGSIDGGVAANNPSMCALAQAIDPASGGQTLTDIVMLSLGSGCKPQYIDSSNGDWGLRQWGFNIIDLLLEANMGTADYQCRQLLSESRYLRINPNLPYNIAMDDVGAISDLIAVADSLDLYPIKLWLQGSFLP